MEKSYVTIEKRVCLACSESYDTNALLLDKRLKPRFDMHTTTGFGLCPKCAKEGYVLLIEIDPSKSIVGKDTARPENAHRTGELIYLKTEAFKRVFGQEPASEVAYIEPAVTKYLKEAQRVTEQRHAEAVEQHNRKGE